MRGERPDLLGVSLRFRYAFVAPVASLRGALMAIVGGGKVAVVAVVRGRIIGVYGGVRGVQGVLIFFLAIILLTEASFIPSVDVSVGEVISILTFNSGQKRHIYCESQLHLHPPLLLVKHKEK